MLRASFIGLLVKIGLELVVALLVFAPIPLLELAGGLIPGFIGGFTGGFMLNRGFRGGAGSGALMAFLMVFLTMFFFIPGRYGMQEQFPGVGALILRSAPAAASMMVGAAVGGLLRESPRLRRGMEKWRRASTRCSYYKR